MPDPVEWTTERWPVNKLKDWPHNPRRITEKGLDDLKASMTRLGYIDPIAVNADGTIIGGHARKRVLKDLKIKDVEVRVPSRLLTEKEVEEAVIRLNKNIAGEWDFDKLANHFDVGELMDWGFAPEDFGIINTPAEGLTDPDDVPEEPPAPISRPGDVWVLGNHRIMCGDSTSADDVGKLLNGQLADFCFSSPPYSMQRDYKTGIDDWDALMNGVYSILPVKPGAQVLVNLGLVHNKGEWTPYWDKWIEFMRVAGWKRFALYVWDQGPGLPGDWNGRLAPSFELIFHFCKESRKAAKTKESKCAGETSNGGLRNKDGSIGGRSKGASAIQSNKIPDSVIRVMRQKGKVHKDGSHPAPFPVQLPIEMMEAYSKEGDICFEPFCGSGTQIISAEKTGRLCYGMELAPAYTDVAIKRWQDFTGQSAIHEATGQSYAEMTSQRKQAA